jgi:hypothetical protein
MLSFSSFSNKNPYVVYEHASYSRVIPADSKEEAERFASNVPAIDNLNVEVKSQTGKRDQRKLTELGQALFQAWSQIEPNVKIADLVKLTSGDKKISVVETVDSTNYYVIFKVTSDSSKNVNYDKSVRQLDDYLYTLRS